MAEVSIIYKKYTSKDSCRNSGAVHLCDFIPQASKMAAQSQVVAGRLKETAASLVIENFQSELNDLSNKIWKNPELGCEEYKAHDLLTNLLEKKGFTVERSFTGIKTAFKATFGQEDPMCV